MADQTIPADEQVLTRLYQETIDHHRTYLDRLHNAFNERCEAVGTEAKEKLKGINESDEEGRKEILMKEQEDLDKTLEELKYAINKSNADARAKLEEIQTQIDEGAMSIEEELANL